MQAWENCSACKGYGHFSCRDCVCASCSGQGKNTCSKCKSGYIPCEFCKATGNIPKNFLWMTNHVNCPKCQGHGKFSCPACHHTGFQKCSQCNGAGRKIPCSTCGGTQKVKCSHCDGDGKILSQEFKNWSTSLNKLPVDRLDYEIKKRQRKIDQLQREESKLSIELDDIVREYWDQPSLYRHGDGGREPGMYNRTEISRLIDEIKEIEEEIAVIDKVIDAKWR